MSGYAPGRYRLKITNQGFSESAEKKTPFFFLEGEPVAQQDGAEWYETEFKYPRTISLWITENTAANVGEKLKGLGWPGGKWSSLDLAKPNSHSFVGTEIEVVCKHEPGLKDASKLFEKWDLPFGGEREPTESNPSIAGKLDAMFGRAAAPAKAPARKPAAKPAAATVANGAADDVPF